MLSESKCKLIRHELETRGYSFVPSEYLLLTGNLRESQLSLWNSWSDLEVDRFVQGEHKFRFRRYGRFLLLPDEELVPLPHVPFFQSKENNSYAGGIPREFAPLVAHTINNQFLAELIRLDFKLLPVSEGQRKTPWEIDVHQYRVVGDCRQPGYPTPEGIHRDGFDFFAVHLVNRINVLGGISQIYNDQEEQIDSLTLKLPMDSLIVQDSRVMHAVTPIFPMDSKTEACRDTLIMNFISTPRQEVVCTNNVLVNAFSSSITN